MLADAGYAHLLSGVERDEPVTHSRAQHRRSEQIAAGHCRLGPPLPQLAYPRLQPKVVDLPELDPAPTRENVVPHDRPVPGRRRDRRVPGTIHLVAELGGCLRLSDRASQPAQPGRGRRVAILLTSIHFLLSTEVS